MVVCLPAFAVLSITVKVLLKPHVDHYIKARLKSPSHP